MIKNISAIILLAVIVFGAYRGIATLNTSAKEIEKINAEDIVDALVAESSGKTPKMINDEMRLENVKKNGRQITFLNTVVSASSNEVDPEEVKSIYFPVMSKSLCGNENMLIALSKGVVRPRFRRHLIVSFEDRRIYGEQAIHRRVQGRGGQAGQRAWLPSH